MRFLVVMVLVCASLSAGAQQVRLVTPWGVGGGSDFVTRTLADQLEKTQNYSVVVENRSGANGALAGREVARSGPDRRTYLSDSINMLINSWFVKGGIGFDPMHDLVPVASLALQHHVLVVSANLPVHTVKDLISLSKKYPGEITFGHSGTGAPHHIVGLVLQRNGHTTFNEIGYKTTLAALTAVAAGEIAVASGNLTASMPLIQSGRVRAIAKLSPDAVIPGLESLELGSKSLPGLESSSHEVLWAPASYDRQSLALLGQQVTQIVNSREFRDRVARAGITAKPMTAQELDAVIQSRIKVWRSMLRDHIVN